MVTDQPRPQGPKGLTCPLRGKDCSKVCQSCMFWRGIEVEKPGAPPYMVWDCALGWIMETGKLNNYRLDGIQKAAEGTRNRFDMLVRAQKPAAIPQGEPQRLIAHAPEGNSNSSPEHGAISGPVTAPCE